MHRLWFSISMLLAAICAPSRGQLTTNDSSWLRKWTRIADEARNSQPHFVAPIVTTHVMLVQQFRYDMWWQQDASGATITSNYGGSRGLEIIPSTRFEVGIFPPSYIVHQANVPNGFGDLAYQVKFRAVSAAEGKGDYFVGFFLGGSVPTGNVPNGVGHAIWTPNIALAKGIGPVDIQTTFGANIPNSGTNVLGRALLFNTAVDYQIMHRFWPMIEQNSTFWIDGPLTGKKQVFLTPGIVFGPFPLDRRLHFGIGFGEQIAVTSFHQYDHRWILSLRFPF